MTTPTLTDYFKNQKLAEEKYGPNTVCIYEVGYFYEIYEIKLENNKIGKCSEIFNLLGMQLTKKNSRLPHSKENPYMMGCPTYAIDKHIAKLIDNNYTVVVYDQEKNTDDNKFTRTLSKIYSPSTYIDTDSDSNNNYLVTYYLDKNGPTYSVHMAALDLTTGDSKLYEVYSKDETKIKNDIYRFIHSHDTKEILKINKENNEKNTNNEIKKEDEKKEVNKETNTNKEINKEKQRISNATYKKLSYQNEFLKKVFDPDNTLINNISPIEYLNLHFYSDLVYIFVECLQFAYEHDHSIIKKIKIPEILSDTDILVLNNDSMYQLNVNDIFKLVNKTQTNMGKRELKSRLLRPITNISEINKRYDLIDKMKPELEKFKPLLSQIADLEKKHRLAQLNKLTPSEFYKLTSTYEVITKLLPLTQKILNDTNKEILQKELNDFIKEYENKFILESMKDQVNFNINKSIFKRGIYVDIDIINDEISKLHEKLEETKNILSDHIDKKKNCIKLCVSDADGYYFSTTPKRANVLKTKIDKTYRFETNKSQAKIKSTEIDKISISLRTYEGEIAEMIISKYFETINYLYDKYWNTLTKINNIIINVDIAYSGAFVAQNFCYNRPIIYKTNNTGKINNTNKNNTSYINCTKLRHPLIEQLINEEYVPNDICLNYEGKEKSNKSGLLLYGINSSGKSSLLRAIGSNIIMAQAGMFVAAETFEYLPYTMLISKISRVDNLFKGESTFINEMFELKNMLTLSDNRSLILADELCAGTESLSATSIVASTILNLVKKDATFAFSTHLHTLMGLDEIKNLEEIYIKHFKVEMKDGKVTYNRQLHDGHGDTLYGLEIANTLGLGSDFIAEAFKFRSLLEKKENCILSTKTSRYNKDLYVHECVLCHKQAMETGPLHTHHLCPQKDADKCGIIKDKTFHKNKLHNLIVVCRTCHENIHNGSCEF